jgi:hypothetical protein
MHDRVIRSTSCHFLVRLRNGMQAFQPGKPQQNAYVERCNRPVRHE